MMQRNLHVEYLNKDFTAYDAEAVRSGIIRALIYFDIFNYPLTAAEIVQFSPVKLNGLAYAEAMLHGFESSCIIFRFGEYYSLRNDVTLVERRRTGNRNASDVWAKALRRSQFIYSFPFVRSVNISGSLSKNYFDETTDFDFFIITSPGRLWLCRMILTLYKKIFLLNSRKYFCVNYYIDTEDLSIPDENLFSATEIITLKNTAGETVYREFMQTNEWVKEFFPNHYPDYSYLENDKQRRFKIIAEKIFGGKPGKWLDDLSFRLTRGFINKKYKHLGDEVLKTNMRTKRHASKHHPQGFQFKVLKAYNEKCRDFETLHDIKLSHG